jgi:hypothetical protein
MCGSHTLVVAPCGRRISRIEAPKPTGGACMALEAQLLANSPPSSLNRLCFEGGRNGTPGYGPLVDLELVVSETPGAP